MPAPSPIKAIPLEPGQQMYSKTWLAARLHGVKLDELKPAVVRQTSSHFILIDDHPVVRALWKVEAKPSSQPARTVMGAAMNVRRQAPHQPRETWSAPKPMPYAKWPKDALKIAEDRQPGEAGVGDTIKRKFGTFGVIYKVYRRLIRKPCNCDDDQAWLNALYPYSIISQPPLE